MISVPDSIQFGSALYGRRPAVDLDRFYVLPDWQTKRFNFAPRPAAPDPGIFPVSADVNEWPQTDFCPFGESWQWFYVYVLAMAKYHRLWNDLTRDEKSYIIRAFKGITGSDKAFNNNNGTDIKSCYPCGEIRNEGAKWESLITCRNYVWAKPAVTNAAGRRFRELYSFHSGDAPPSVTMDILNDPRIQTACIVNPDRTFQEFPQLDGTPVPALFLTRGPRLYPEDEMIPA